jgi:hypothetical protein
MITAQNLAYVAKPIFGQPTVLTFARKTKENHDKSGQESQPAQQDSMQLLSKYKSTAL